MASFVDKLTPEQKKRASLIASELKKLGITNKYVVSGILAVVSKESNFNRLSELNYANTDNGRIKLIFGSRVSKYSDAQLTALKKDENKFFEAVYGGAFGLKNFNNSKVGDGAKYKGRGYNQITGKVNYEKVGKLIGVDLVSHPELLETPEIAAKGIAAFFKLNLDDLIKSGKFQARYLLDSTDKVNSASEGVNIAYDINAGNSKQRLSDTTGGYATATARVSDFFTNLSDFIITNPIKTGGGILGILLLGVGAYYLSKGGLPKI
jgi:predicted chitinase